MYAYISIVDSEAAEAKVTKNTYEYLIDDCNDAGLGNSLLKIVAAQGGKELNRHLPCNICTRLQDIASNNPNPKLKHLR